MAISKRIYQKYTLNRLTCQGPECILIVDMFDKYPEMAMTPREERGLVIAAVCKLNKTPDGWLVPSQSKGETVYTVDPIKQTCTCPDHQEAGHKCKHIFAVEFTVKREYNPDGTVT